MKRKKTFGVMLALLLIGMFSMHACIARADVSASDLNGDKIVDILDLRICAKAFGCKPVDMNWNPIADLNSDELIDIFDLRLVGKHYGEPVL